MAQIETAEPVRLPNTAAPKMMDAIATAKRIVQDMTLLPIDALVLCKKSDEGGWTVVIDVIESAARMGDNDLLSSYEVSLDTHAALTQFTRLRRYHREDRDQG